MDLDRVAEYLKISVREKLLEDEIFRYSGSEKENHRRHSPVAGQGKVTLIDSFFGQALVPQFSIIKWFFCEQVEDIRIKDRSHSYTMHGDVFFKI